jgi:hypothetical protein
LLGRTFYCVLLSDAAAIKTANDILTGDDPTIYVPHHLSPLIEVLQKYSQLWAAERLSAEG